MDRQTLRDWVHRFNEEGPDGLVDGKAKGASPKLTASQLEELAAKVETGPDPVSNGIVPWRRIDLNPDFTGNGDSHLPGVDLHRRRAATAFGRDGPRRSRTGRC